MLVLDAMLSFLNDFSMSLKTHQSKEVKGQVRLHTAPGNEGREEGELKSNTRGNEPIKGKQKVN